MTSQGITSRIATAKVRLVTGHIGEAFSNLNENKRDSQTEAVFTFYPSASSNSESREEFDCNSVLGRCSGEIII
jgi:hypothetical protein